VEERGAALDRGAAEVSVQAVLQAALADCLRGAGGLDGVAVFDAPPVRGALPYVVIEEAVLGDWSTKDMAGREGRLAVTIRDGGERPVRLRGLAGAAEDAVLGMAGEVGEGWRVASLVLVRSRLVREGAGWVSVSEFRVRVLREG
jgi:hypothetical protein